MLALIVTAVVMEVDDAAEAMHIRELVSQQQRAQVDAAAADAGVTDIAAVMRYSEPMLSILDE